MLVCHAYLTPYHQLNWEVCPEGIWEMVTPLPKCKTWIDYYYVGNVYFDQL